MPPSRDKGSRPQYLVLGEILRPHGVRGEVRLRLLTDYPERIAALTSVYLGSDPQSPRLKRYHIEHMRMHQDYGLLKLQGVGERDDAERLRELLVMVHIDEAVPLEDDEVYLFQLIGMAVHTEAGEALGTVRDVLETGANDVYIVDSPQHGEVLIPVTEETILSTDVETGIITVSLPDGLLP